MSRARVADVDLRSRDDELRKFAGPDGEATRPPLSTAVVSPGPGARLGDGGKGQHSVGREPRRWGVFGSGAGGTTNRDRLRQIRSRRSQIGVGASEMGGKQRKGRRALHS